MKLPRDLSGTAVIKTLERLGFVQVRQTGSHVRLVLDRRHVTVPKHGYLAPGTLRNILRQAGVELDVLLENLS